MGICCHEIFASSALLLLEQCIVCVYFDTLMEFCFQKGQKSVDIKSESIKFINYVMKGIIISSKY